MNVNSLLVSWSLFDFNTTRRASASFRGNLCLSVSGFPYRPTRAAVRLSRTPLEKRNERWWESSRRDSRVSSRKTRPFPSWRRWSGASSSSTWRAGADGPHAYNEKMIVMCHVNGGLVTYLVGISRGTIARYDNATKLQHATRT